MQGSKAGVFLKNLPVDSFGRLMEPVTLSQKKVILKKDTKCILKNNH